jgi:hypothetical protein
MSLSKLCLFTFAAILSGFAAVEMLNVQIMEYEVPTPNSRPHDPAIAPDGSLGTPGRRRTNLVDLIRRVENLRNIP